jgi:hypothetical protein
VGRHIRVYSLVWITVLQRGALVTTAAVEVAQVSGPDFDVETIVPIPPNSLTSIAIVVYPSFSFLAGQNSVRLHRFCPLSLQAGGGIF